MVGGTGPKKTLRMVAQYADACNIGDWVGKDNMQKAIDDLKGHCKALGRDYDTVEKTSLSTVHLSGMDTVDSIIRRIKELSESLKLIQPDGQSRRAMMAAEFFQHMPAGL